MSVERSIDVERRISSPVVQAGYLRRISWGALFAGVVVAAVVQMLLSVLGVGVGAATVDAQGRATAGVGIGAGIWLAVSSIIAFFCAGWTAGRLAGVPRAIESTLHGFLSWGLTVVVGAFIFTSALGGLLGSAANLVGQSMGGVASAAASNGGSSGGLSATLSQAATNIQNKIDQQGGTAGAAQQAQNATQAAAGNVAGAALAGFAVMLLGAGAGALGGFISRPRNTILTSLPSFERRAAR